MKSSKMKKMKKRLLALLLCMVMMMNGSVPALASEVTASDEVNAISQDAGTQTASLETVHEHTGECYSRSKVSDALICGKEVVEGHTHGDTCYEVTNTPECICRLEETPGHSHDEGCYTTVETKNCSLEEHSHGDGCYTTEFTCGTEEHSHGDECFITETVNVCGQEEVEAHTHGDGCYTTVENKTLTCELEEAEGHAHSDECYEWTEELTCTIPAETPTVEPEITICEVCGKETCECEAEIEICEVCGKETCECEAEEEAEPITLTTEVDGTTITLAGPAEAFQEGMNYSIEATVVEAKKEIKVIEEVLEEVAVEQEKLVESYQAFDIKIIETDEEGNVTNDNFQPLNETPVMVTFSSKEVTESVENEETVTSVLHVDTEKKEAEDMGAEVTEDKDVAIETTHFSIYVYVEFAELGEIKLYVEHWIEDTEERLYEDSEIVLENGFRGSVEDLGEICYGDQVDIGYKVSKVYRDVEGKWKEITSSIVLSEDTYLKVEYVPTSEYVQINDYPSTMKESEQDFTISKVADGLDENDQTNVTLSVPGEAQDYSSDIVLIIGNGPANNYKYITDSIKKMLVATDGTPTKIKLGFVGFADTTEEEIVLPLTEMNDVVLGNSVADYRIAGRYNDGSQYTESAEDYKARKAALYAAWEAENPLLVQDMEYIVAKALERAEDVYNGINLESSLITARDMLAADTSVPADRKHMIVVSTGLTYWFDNDAGEPVTIVGKNIKGNIMHGNKYWLQARDASTNTSAGYYMKGWMLVNENGAPNYQKSWERYWDMNVSWIDADQDKYVYNPGKTYSEFYYNGNSTEIRPDNNANYRYGSAIQNAEDLAKVIDAVPYFAGGANPATNSNAAHALNYERAQYESWVVYNQMQTSIGESFTTVLKDKNGNYKTVDGLGFNCYAIAIGVSSNPGEDDRWLASNQIGYNFMRMLGGENTVNYRDGDTSFFDPIENKILYSCSKGSTVVDYIGYDPEKGNFEFVQDPGTIKLVKGVGEQATSYTTTQIATKEGATSSYEFTEVGGEGPTFWLDYYYGDGKTSEKFVWTFGEDISRYKPVALTYKLTLTEKAEEEGIYDVNTNISATLYPKDSEGNDGEPEVFPIPNVEYTVIKTKKINILKVNATDSNIKLKDAEFALYKADKKIGTVDQYTQVDLNPETAKVDGVTTGENGIAEFEIKYGTYKLKETKAPEGYMISEEEYTIVYDKSGVWVDGKLATEANGVITIKVGNMPLYELPSTGGFGSSLYTLSGAALMLGSSLIAYKKKREEELGSKE